MKLHLPLSLLVYVCAVSAAVAAVGDTGNAWDSNWGEAGLAGAPDAAAAQYQADITVAGVTALVRPAGAAAPYDFGTYTAITLVGAGNTGAQIIGGASATESDTTGAVARNTWIAAVAGEYDLLVGGNYADNWRQGSVFDFTGDTHILVHGADVAHIIGGNYKDGQGAAFTGDSYISVMSGNVSGAIVGAGVVTHNRDVQFTGDTHVFVYTPLADNSGPILHQLPANLVLGGFGWSTNTWKTQTLTGNTHVTVDLSDDSGAAATFAKHLVGGGFTGAGGNTQMIDGNTNVSIDLGQHAMSAGAYVVAGPWVHAGAATVTGTAKLSISGGTFSGPVVGGAWLAAGKSSASLGAVQVQLTGAILNGSFYGGHYVNGTGSDPFTASLGDVSIVLNGGAVNNMIGGSYVPRNNADTVLQQGNISIDLQAGSVSGSVYAAGQQLAASALQTQSTTVTIGAAVQFADSSVVSGGYAGDSVSSTMLGERTLIFADAQSYTNTATLSVQDFDVVQVAAGAEVPLASLAGSSALRKAGAGDLLLSTHTGLSDITVQGGSLALQAGQDAADLLRLILSADTSVSGLTGTLSTADTQLSLTLSPQNIGENTASPPMLRGTDFTLNIAGADNVVLDLSADAVVALLEAHREAGRVSWLSLTDGTLQWADGAQAAIVPDLFPYGIRVSGVSGGNLLLSGQAQGLYYVTADAATTDPHELTTYPSLGMYEGVVIEGGQRLTLSLPGDAHDSTAATIRNLVGGTGSELLLQNSSATGTVQVLLEQTSDTTMAGVITAESGTQLTKTGAAALAVQGGLCVPELELQQGALLLQGQGNELYRIKGGGSLTLAEASQTTIRLNTDTGEQVLDLAELIIASGANLTLYSTGLRYLGTGEYVLGEVETLSTGDYTLTLSGTPFLRADPARSYLAAEDGRLSLFLVATHDNPLADAASSHNARAGATLLWDSALPEGGEAVAVFDEVMQLLRHGDTAVANNLMAAVAGASYATLGSAFRHSLQQRLYAMRNRAAHMSLPDCYVYEDVPYINAWVNADGAYSELSARGTQSGYQLSSWGATLGLDAAFNDAWSAGLAFSALYGDMDARAPDVMSGDFDSYTLAFAAHYEKCGWSHSFIAAGSRLQADLDRHVRTGSGAYSTSGDTHGFGFGLLYELGYKFAFNRQQSSYLQPLAHVLYAHSSVSGFTETGADAALRVGNQSQNALVFGLGLRAQTPIGESEYDRTATLQGHALLKIHALDRRSEASVSFAGASAASSVISAQDGVLGAEIGAGLNIPIGVSTGVLYLDAAAEFRAHSVDVFGSVGYRFRF